MKETLYPRKVVVIDGKDFSSARDFHLWIRDYCDWPYYGCNSDALWDFSSTDSCFSGVLLIWKHHETSIESMGKEFERIINVFTRVRELFLKENDDMRFDYLLW